MPPNRSRNTNSAISTTATTTMFPNGAGMGSILISQITTPTIRQKTIKATKSDIMQTRIIPQTQVK